MKARAILFAIAALTLTGSAVPNSDAAALRVGRVGVRFTIAKPPPPAPAAVVIRPTRPGVGYVWRSGHYTWTGGRYVWQAGAWIRPPKGKHTWVPGHWRNGVWVAGHWA